MSTDLYFVTRGGTRPAMRKFTAVTGAGPPSLGSVEFWRMVKLMPSIRRNLGFWLEHEPRQYPRYQPIMLYCRLFRRRHPAAFTD